MSELNKIALKIISNGKGILAADESNGTMTKRLENVQVPSTPENRLLFRETLFSSTSMKNCIGGVILYDETIKQISSSKKKIPELISETGAVTGIKVDTGAKVLSNSADEKINFISYFNLLPHETDISSYVETINSIIETNNFMQFDLTNQFIVNS